MARAVVYRDATAGFDAGGTPITLPRWLGAWSGATAYVIGDAVSLAGSAYVCILGHTNHTPPNATYWDLLAAKGDTGSTGSTGAAGATGAAGPNTVTAATTTNLNGVLKGDGANVSGSATASDIGAQPVDSDLTAIAALTTTSYGRAFLALADAAAARTALALGTAAVSASGDFDAAGSAAAAQAASQPLDTDLTAIAALATTSFGRSLLALADAAAGRTALGLGTLATQSGTFSGTSSGTNTGDQTTVSGNAGTATALATGRTIDGQTFDGTANITVIAPGAHAATSKATPVDADELPLVDSAASNVLKKLTWANLKATVKAYTDTLYQATGAAAGGALAGTYPNPTFALGPTVKLFDSTLGADTASIDTGAAGIATGYDVLEIFMYLRTDEAVVLSQVNLTFNNDSSAIYDRQRYGAQQTTTFASAAIAQTSLPCYAAGASASANFFAANRLAMPSYAQTTGYKIAEHSYDQPDSTAANMTLIRHSFGYRSTVAISRLAITPATGGKKLKAGSRLLIYGR